MEREYEYIHVYGCKIEVIYFVYYCSFNYYMRPMAKTIRTEVKLIGAEACKEIHKRGRFSFHNDFGWTGIPRNATTKKHATIVGYSDSKGNCNHGTWNDGHETYNKANNIQPCSRRGFY